MRLLAAAVVVLALAPAAWSAKKPYLPPTIEERHAAYHAKTNQPPMTAREQRRHAWKVMGARVLIQSHSLIGWALEKRSNQRGVDEQVNAIITAGELRVSTLGMDKASVGRAVQEQIDGLRAGRRTLGSPSYEVRVPPNLLGIE